MQKYFKEGLKNYLNPYFKANGFKHSGNYYIKSFDEYSLIFNLQKSQYISKSHIQFTFNIGINIYNFYDLAKERCTNKKLGTFWKINARIGQLLPVKKDKWYSIGEKINLIPINGNDMSFQVDNDFNCNLKEVFTEINEDIEYILQTYPFTSSIEEILLSIKDFCRNSNLVKYLLLNAIDKKFDKEKVIHYLNEYIEEVKPVFENNEEIHDKHKNDIIKFIENIKEYIKDTM